eukprot:CAMPEP_0113406384 /NCGR_PEP_ID=MMETSP0013_2-20120614/19480_1 /TAXON_ID=2843 ORGANISM="Skeletonema costatum, Strain 1716" /NCGR_SAMPLE_ID=MMETSP0013_2 /ASSEMBLY_ACC=CAM_ASM_000158 /LENGTH=421 /DNA_ID=CAMNT_0000292221 /DNA_START=80 /DNA_END=1345 /DNA_ORIENTATION=+ /assembly_acc=CAM_ASM_000158
MGWTAEQSKILSIIPHFTGAFSFIGSSSIIIMILRDRRKKLSKPYYRLLFAMCVFDIFASVALGLSTWPIPEGSPGVYDPKGTVGTCSAQAFFIQANIASPVYNFMLSVYFLLRVKYGMNENQIGRRAEPIMHVITVIFGLGTSFLCLGLSLFNDSTLWCWVNASPKGCDQSYANNGETDCERGDNAEIYRWAIFFGPLWACIIGCMVIMIIIFMSVRKQENKLKKYQFKPRRESESSNAGDEEFERKKKEEERRRHAQSRQVAWQGLRFVGVFYLTWAFATVNRLLQLVNGGSYFWLMCLHTIFVPMQGFFNFLVYIYPRFKARKRAGVRSHHVGATIRRISITSQIRRWNSVEETNVESPPVLAEKSNDGGDEENGAAVAGEGSKVEDTWEENEAVTLPVKSVSLMKGSFDGETTHMST